jgi:hypothetical protein
MAQHTQRHAAAPDTQGAAGTVRSSIATMASSAMAQFPGNGGLLSFALGAIVLSGIVIAGLAVGTTVVQRADISA